MSGPCLSFNERQRSEERHASRAEELSETRDGGQQQKEQISRAHEAQARPRYPM
jgi:hypothetical protein